jgi:hypothetical protein
MSSDSFDDDVVTIGSGLGDAGVSGGSRHRGQTPYMLWRLP